jgi:hypothetical protein
VTSGDRDDLLFLHAAGALDANERAEVESWLETGGAEAEAALERARHEVAALAGSRPPIAPPEGVRERLMARIRNDRAAAHAPRAEGGWLRLALAAGIASLVAAGAAGIVAYRSGQAAGDAQLRAVRADLEEAAAELAATRELQASLDGELSELEARADALEADQVLAAKKIETMRAEDSESLALTGTGSQPEAKARVFWDWDTWYCYLHATGLAKDPSRVYAVWLFTEDGVLGVGTFRADAEGHGEFLGPVPHDVGHVLRAGVSIEPDENLTAKPRGEVVLIGPSA